jgi:hypothetical protein
MDRIKAARSIFLSKFKKSMTACMTDEKGVKKSALFTNQIDVVLKVKQDTAKKDEIEAEKKKAVEEAMAQASAEGEGGLMRRFFG